MSENRVAVPSIGIVRRPFLPADMGHELRRQFLLADLTPGMSVLDVGCGSGSVMSELTRRGVSVQGVEIDSSLVRSCREFGLSAIEGRAEKLPIPDNSIDTIVCSVVLPYTDERQAVAEFARVLKPGGSVVATCHGIGYGMNYLFRHPNWKGRCYGFRMLANTLFYRFTRRRLPGFLGDTLCQTSRRMNSYYRTYGLTLDREEVVGCFLGAPIFLCQSAVKR